MHPKVRAKVFITLALTFCFDVRRKLLPKPPLKNRCSSNVHLVEPTYNDMFFGEEKMVWLAIMGAVFGMVRKASKLKLFFKAC